MKAATITAGDIGVEERPDPQPGEGELLVRVRSAGINGADILQKRGRYPAPPGAPQDIPGLEFAGEVVAVGRGASRFSEGDRVMGIVGGGAQAELITIHERIAMPAPGTLSWPEAGGLPEAYCTAFDALVSQAGLSPGEKVLVNGGAGGVGTAALQIAKVLGAFPVATVRNADLVDRVRQLSVGPVVVAEAGSDAALEHGPFDVILELVGAPNWSNSLRGLAPRGRICFIGVGAGAKAEINVLHLMNKRGTIHGSTLRSLPLEDKARIARDVEHGLLPHFDTGALRVPVDKVFSLAQVAEAYDYFAGGGKFGKVTLDM